VIFLLDFRAGLSVWYMFLLLLSWFITESLGLRLWSLAPLSIFLAISWRSVLFVEKTGVCGEYCLHDIFIHCETKDGIWTILVLYKKTDGLKDNFSVRQYTRTLQPITWRYCSTVDNKLVANCNIPQLIRYIRACSLYLGIVLHCHFQSCMYWTIKSRIFQESPRLIFPGISTPCYKACCRQVLILLTI
jgi:hypothetical protein